MMQVAMLCPRCRNMSLVTTEKMIQPVLVATQNGEDRRVVELKPRMVVECSEQVKLTVNGEEVEISCWQGSLAFP